MSRPEWRKSSRSGTQEGMDCVEVGDLSGAIGVRDSKNPHGPVLELTRTELGVLVSGIKAGRHEPYGMA